LFKGNIEKICKNTERAFPAPACPLDFLVSAKAKAFLEVALFQFLYPSFLGGPTLVLACLLQAIRVHPANSLVRATAGHLVLSIAHGRLISILCFLRQKFPNWRNRSLGS